MDIETGNKTMTDKLIYSNILSVLNALRWTENRDGFSATERDNALRVVLGMLNKVSKPENFTVSRSLVFKLMNEAKANLA